MLTFPTALSALWVAEGLLMRGAITCKQRNPGTDSAASPNGFGAMIGGSMMAHLVHGIPLLIILGGGYGLWRWLS